MFKRNERAVGHDFLVVCRDGFREVEGEQQGGRPHAPEGKLGAIFVLRHTRSADYEVVAGFSSAVNANTHHVGIIETIDSGISPEVFHTGNALNDANSSLFSIPSIARIVSSAPYGRPCGETPFPRLTRSPFAHIQKDVST